MDIDKFAEEMLLSQTNGNLTDYCLKYWDDMLEIMKNSHNDMDMLIELAVNVGGQRSTEALSAYSDFVDKLKEQQ